MFSKKLLSLALLATLLAVGSASHTRPYRRQDTTSAGTCSNTGSGSGTSSTNSGSGSGTSSTNSGSGSGTNSTNSGTGTQSNTQPALPSGCTRNATVQAGDTCDIFSARNDVSTFQLANTNIDAIDSHCSNLFPGEILCLGIPNQDCSTISEVQQGDTCTSIASNASIPLSTLMANNPYINSDCQNIYPGEVLCIDNNIFQYTILAPGSKQTGN